MTQPTGAAALETVPHAHSMRAHIACLVAEHAWLIDHGQAGRIASLFTEDARLLGIGPDLVGRAAIQAWASAREAMTGRLSRHVQTNLRLAPVSETECRGTVVLTLYRHDGPEKPEPASYMVAEYDDFYRKGPDGAWRFAERRLSVLFGG